MRGPAPTKTRWPTPRRPPGRGARQDGTMNKRLEMLEKLIASGNADSFARYALALEYRKLGRLDDALAQFETLRAADPTYLAQYLMAGQILLELRRPGDARGWLEQGVELARSQGDGKALGELESALEDALSL